MAKTSINQSDNRVTLKPSEAITAAFTALKAGRNVMVWGKPGIGKSDMSVQIAKLLGADYYDFRAAQADPCDAKGLPIIDPVTGETRWTKPGFVKTDGRWLLNFEELNRGSQSVENSLLQAARERQLGEYKFSDEVFFMACCNYSESAGARKMGDAMLNRWTHIHMTVDLDDWSAWAYDNGVNPMTIAFLRFAERDAQCGSMLHRYDANSEANPTPRSWAACAQITDQVQAGGVDPRVATALYAGTVGRGAAVEYEAFLAWLSKINIDAILLSPDTADVPVEPAAKYAVAAALSNRAEVGNFAGIIRFLDRMAAEYAAMAISAATARNKELCTVDAFSQWFLKNKSILC